MNVLNLAPDQILMKGNTVLTQYIITDWKLEYIDKGIHSLTLWKPNFFKAQAFLVIMRFNLWSCFLESYEFLYVNLLPICYYNNIFFQFCVCFKHFKIFYFKFLLFSESPSNGTVIVVILKRRIINEILTTYLPSFLLIIIVYITNFFKPFFFEAVVTVNLTALLVLTTLFISVSGK